jgi:hypothetical protein
MTLLKSFKKKSILAPRVISTWPFHIIVSIIPLRCSCLKRLTSQFHILKLPHNEDSRTSEIKLDFYDYKGKPKETERPEQRCVPWSRAAKAWDSTTPFETATVHKRNNTLSWTPHRLSLIYFVQVDCSIVMVTCIGTIYTVTFWW